MSSEKIPSNVALDVPLVGDPEVPLVFHVVVHVLSERVEDVYLKMVFVLDDFGMMDDVLDRDLDQKVVILFAILVVHVLRISVSGSVVIRICIDG